MSSSHPPGTKLGRYEIRAQLGAGGMGEIYLAHDTQLGRVVALKILPSTVATDKSRMHRFIYEAKAASALNHPNILTVYEIGQINSTHFIATEYIEGETLRQRVATQKLSVTQILDISIQTANALATAHQAGIAHRDIKPDNIMIRSDGIVKVVDFGLAKLAATDNAGVDAEAPTKAQLTDPGTVVGTASYMSPEQARGLPLDARTDIFSLGVVLYEMVAGLLPFSGSSSTEVLAAILSDKEAQPLARFSRNIPAELERIVAKALRKDRDERYQTIKDLVLDLKTLKQELEFAVRLEHSHASDTRSKNEAVVTNAVPEARPTSSSSSPRAILSRRSLIGGLVVLLLITGAVAYWYSRRPASSAVESIAVMPFVNESGNADTEYLSDGMTETLINSLSQLPQLAVKSRSTVFRYKGRLVDPQQVGAELAVQAVLNGRVVQRGNDLILYLSLVDARNGNQIWGEQYNRRIADLVSLQQEIARDVSLKLRARLSGAEERKLSRKYTENVEAYQLYLKGRYHSLKTIGPEIQKAVGYFEQAIAIDPGYVQPYVGLADSHRSLSLVGEMKPAEVFPKAKAAAQRAIQIDDSYAEAHAVLGYIMFWHDWDWQGAENQFKRALELDPNSADTHISYGHLLSNTGRHAEALVKARQARELDPLNLRINSLEGQFLLQAGKPDEALDRLGRTFELDPNYFIARTFASRVYFTKGMVAEALAEARKAREISPNLAHPLSQMAFVLAKTGQRAEAREVLKELLRFNSERYVPPFFMALPYVGLGERDEAMIWLERGYEARDPRMTFLKADTQWSEMQDLPEFQELLRRMRL